MADIPQRMSLSDFLALPIEEQQRITAESIISPADASPELLAWAGVLTAHEMERISPDERAEVVRNSQMDSLDDLDPDFRLRVEHTGRRLLRAHDHLEAE